MVTLAGCSPDGKKLIVFDSELIPNDNIANRRNDADWAVEMLRRLLDENGDAVRDGLRGLVYDMSMTSAVIDRTLDMRVLPITKTPRSAGGGIRRGVGHRRAVRKAID